MTRPPAGRRHQDDDDQDFGYDDPEDPQPEDMSGDDDSEDTLPCPRCGAMIWEGAERCGRCGAWVTPGTGIKRTGRGWVGVAFLVIAALGVAGVWCFL
ncbi:MAG: hypothetical protein HRU75_05955 [Planctomycetia bacterium]|nr:MAG: hypothetical protein HRU75_05955 [Planctomycetia bacterium]